MIKNFHVDPATRIVYDPRFKAFYIYLNLDKNYPLKVPTAETINGSDQGPLINIDRVDDMVVGIEIIP